MAPILGVIMITLVTLATGDGALALRGEQLVLIDSVMADNVEAGEIEVVVRYLAETADHFERTLFGSDEF